MGKGIKISPTHGLNPSMGVCPQCHQENGELLLLGHIKLPEDRDMKAPRHSLGVSLCKDCQKVYDAGGTMFLEAFEENGNTVRTGRKVGLTEEASRSLLGEHYDHFHPVCFMMTDVFEGMFGAHVFEEEEETEKAEE